MKKPRTAYPDRYTVACINKHDCPFRECMWPGEDKGSYTVGRGYTSYHDVPIPVCMTRHTEGCPTPLPEPDTELARCCHRPAYLVGRAVKGMKTCATCGKETPTWAGKLLNMLPTLPGVKCAHPADQVSRVMIKDWSECHACGGFWDKATVLPHEEPNQTLDSLLAEMTRVFATVDTTCVRPTLAVDLMDGRAAGTEPEYTETYIRKVPS